MLRWIDAAVIGVYFLAVTLIVFFVSRRQKNKEDYLMGGRSLHWFPVALSVVAGGFSSISFIAAPGYVYANDLAYMPVLFMGLLSIPIVFFLVVPFLYKLSLVSIYEYLETRFCPALRYLASALFIISKLGYLAMVIFVSSFALATITGLATSTVLLGIGLVTVILTTFGGMRGTVWADLLQYFTIIVGIGAVMVYFIATGDVGTYWEAAGNAGKTKMFHWDWDLGALSVWAVFLNCTLLGVAGVCSDQTNVQRMLSTRSLRDSMKSYLFSLIFGTPVIIALYVIGVWLYGYVQFHSDVPPEITAHADKVFPYFIAHKLPPVVAGVVLSAILAAGVSTIAAVQHSLTSTFMVDWYERIFRGHSGGKKYVLISRSASLLFGLLGIGGAFYVMYFGNTILEASLIIGSIFAPPLGGIYLLAIFTRRTTSAGAVAGCLIGTAVTILSWWVDKVDVLKINFMWIAVFGIVATCVCGYAFSLLPFAPSRREAAATVPTMEETNV